MAKALCTKLAISVRRRRTNSPAVVELRKEQFNLRFSAPRARTKVWAGEAGSP